MKATGHETRPQPKAENQKNRPWTGGNASKEQKKAAEPEASCRANKSVNSGEANARNKQIKNGCLAKVGGIF